MRPLFVKFSAISDVGRVRENNEDNLNCDGFIVSQPSDKTVYHSGEAALPAIFAVCDGMGGCSSGEKASYFASSILSKYRADILTCHLSELDRKIGNYISEVNQTIRENISGTLEKSGTTLVLVVLREEGIFSYNIGDSRIYEYTASSGLKQISIDHTVAMKKVRNGEISIKEAKKSKDWSKLTACIGIVDSNGDDYRVEKLVTMEYNLSRRILLCSDGLSDMLTDKELAFFLKKDNNPKLVIDSLISTALNNGGKDNVTAIVIDVGDDFVKKGFWEFIFKSRRK